MDSQSQAETENKPGEIDSLLERINGMMDNVSGDSHSIEPGSLLEQIQSIPGETYEKTEPSEAAEPAQETKTEPLARNADFWPESPTTLQAAGLSASFIEELISKYLFAQGEATGRQIADQIRLPFNLIEKILMGMKQEQTMGYVGQAAMNDYVCKLTELGRERGKRYTEASSYFGSAPVPLRDYIKSVKLQSLTRQNPTATDLTRAFSDLLISPNMLGKLGPAVNSGKGMFLYGFPGNGKTSIAERVTSAFGKYIWIPRAINVEGEIMRLFDPMNHIAAPETASTSLVKGEDVDGRWVRIERPTIVVGGELTMEHLEVAYNQQTGTCEAPIQLKSNCGTLVIDDFGRQRMGVDELLNRWIVPLEKRYDYLNTKGGKKVQVPFDQLVIFSTNLEPKDLVDDAFLRRIPYKIEVPNPPEEDFRKLFGIMCKITGFELDESLVEYLIETHYKPTDRPFRNCHPRDLLLQIRSYCLYNDIPLELTKEAFDFAVDNYFSVMS